MPLTTADDPAGDETAANATTAPRNSAEPARTMRLDLWVAPEDAAALRRVPALARGPRPQREATVMVWHDSPAAPLAPRLALCEVRHGEAAPDRSPRGLY